MKREFIINFIILIIINLIIKPTYVFGIEAKIQDMVGMSSYGKFFDYFNFVFLFHFINDFGLQNWNVQYLSKNREAHHAIISDVFITKLLLSAVFFIVCLFFGVQFKYIDTPLLITLMLQFIFSSFFVYLRSNLSALGYYRYDSVISVLDKGLLIVVLGYILWIQQLTITITFFAYALAGAAFVSCIVVLFVIWWKAGFKLRNYSISRSRQMLIKSIPFMLVILLMTAYNRLDGVLLGRWIIDQSLEAGIYAMAYRFYDAANMMSFIIASILLPMFSFYHNDRKQLNNLIDIGFKSAVILSISVVVYFVVYSQQILHMLFSQTGHYHSQVLIILMLSYFFVSMGYVFGTLLIALDKIMLLNKIYLSGLLINILLNSILIPLYKAQGAAITCLITQVWVSFWQIKAVYKDLDLHISKETLKKSCIMLLMYGIIFVFLSLYMPNQWWQGGIIGGISMLGLIVGLNYLDNDQLKTILKAKQTV